MKDIQPNDNLVSLLKRRSDFQKDQVLYRFVQDDDGSVLELTARGLEERVMAVALQLRECAKKGDRALLMYNSGFEFVVAFFGCLYAQVIAVPVYPPKRNQKINRLQSIITDADVKVVLATGKIQKQVLSGNDERLIQSTWIDTESLSKEVDRESFEYPSINMEDVMFLQYTSGSTGSPKGVAVTHNNIMANESVIYEAWEMEKGSHYVSWLPYFHDMGLIGAIVQSLYANMPLTLMNPAYFLRKPVRWLKAITDNKATVSGGPNFAYDLCVDNIKDEDLEGIDLSSWRCAYNGAEPVSARTLRRFAERFAKYGFKNEALYPGYGMAEATLLISGNLNEDGPKWLTVDKKAFQEGKVVEQESSEETIEVVSCGRIWQDHQARIVNPDTLELCAKDEIGELWFQGGSVAIGYWENPEKTKETFDAYIKDTGEGPFLRTGDLAFIRDEEIFITGRLKDLLVIRGRNYYPQDLEFACSQSHESLVANSTAAFSVDTEAGEQLVIVQEVTRTAIRSINTEEVFEAIVSNITAEYELSVYDIVLLIPGRILKTSSGKIQRQGNKKAYLSGEFEPIAQWRNEATTPEFADSEESAEIAALDEDQLHDWMKTKIGELVNTPAHRIQIHKEFNAFGMDSVAAIQLSNDLSTLLNRDVPPNLVYDYPSIAQLSAHLQGLGDHDLVQTERKEERKDVAIIAMSGRFPGAGNIEEFEELLFRGVNAISTPGESLAMDDDPRDISYRSGYLQEVDKFDAGFFEISPKEAKAIDPQQRLLLELSYETFQRAGYATESLKRSNTGIFIGVSNFDYAELSIRNREHKSAYFGTGIALSTTANRLSYYYDFRGPSIAVDTACSSSLVAVHQAVRSIRNGESTMALAGGVNLILSDNVNQYLDAGTLLASDGHCKTFDASADGYVRGEGAGVLLLKSKEQALKDGDNILAVIKGSAVAQDGHSNGILAPNGVAQQKLIREALHDAAVDPGEISYVESHGTGTALGDPIEVSAIDHVYGQQRKDETPLLVGSVKANIGHLESAAGIAGLIKTVLCLNRKEIPRQVHYKEPNPNIDWGKMAVKIPQGIEPLNKGVQPLKAAVSSFGFGGTISHLLLEKYENQKEVQEKEDSNESDIPSLFLLSARGEEALVAQADKLQNHIGNYSVTNLKDIACSSALSRDHFSDRLVVKCHNGDQFNSGLDAFLSGKESESIVRPQREFYQGKKAFLFTGGGAQYAGMCTEYYQSQPVFKAAIDECFELSKEWLEVDLSKILFAEADTEEETLLHRIDYMQPALFAFEYAMSRLWQSWGIEPDVLIGHSLGEIVAACVAGIFSLADGIKLICRRGQLMQSLPAGGVMISIQADAEEVARVIGKDKDAVSIGVINGPTQTVISGEKEKAERVRLDFDAKGFKTKVLQVSHASHSVLMNPILEAYGKVVESITFHKPKYQLIQNRADEGLPIDKAAYWISHLRDTVDFAAGVRELESQGIDVCIEVGANPVLLGIAGNCYEAGDQVTWLPSSRVGESGTVYQSIAQLYVEGEVIDWEAYYAHESVRKVPLPTYAFQRESYWVNTSKSLSSDRGDYSGHPLLGSEIKVAGKEGVFETLVSLKQFPYLNDHRVFDSALLPAAAFCEIIQAFVHQSPSPYILEEINFESPLWLDKDHEYRLQLILQSAEEEQQQFELFSSVVGDESTWQSHARGVLGSPEQSRKESGDQLPPVINGGLNANDFYEAFALKGMEYGEAFQPVKDIYQKTDSILARLHLPDALEEENPYQVHPVLLDGAFQLMSVLFSDNDKVCLPFSLQGYELLGKANNEIWAEARLIEDESRNEVKCAAIRFWDTEGKLLGRIDKLYVKEVSSAILSGEVKTDWLYDLEWRPLKTGKVPDLKGEKWLILGTENESKNAKELTESIIAKGAEAVKLDWPEAKTRLNDFDRVVRLWATDSNLEITAQAESNALKGLKELQSLLKLQAGGDLDRLKTLCWITEGIDSNPALAPLWGLGRVFMQEHSHISMQLLDISSEANDDIDTLTALLNTQGENQLRVRKTGVECLRLMPAKPVSKDSVEHSQLQVTRDGVLDSLEMVAGIRPEPADHEIEIAVSHAGLNFRDVFRALNLIATDQGELGGECSGVITRLGKKVKGFEVGDRVMALAEGTFANCVNTDYRLVAPLPKGIDMEAAATIPITFITAWYGLKNLADLQPHESILIHSAAGGVGMAAIQIAQHFRAQIYGTASQPKQEAVRASGVNHIYDSRTLDFYESIRHDTDNEGVDVVLNSFTKEFVDKSLDLLKDKGRFLEIGKRDIRALEDVEATHPTLSYTAYDLIYLMKNEQDLISDIFNALIPLFDQGILKPLPLTSFPMEQAQEAFKFMSQAKHTGKVVLSNPVQEEEYALNLSAESTVLITGGLGGLGLGVAELLAQQYSIRHLALLGRSKPSKVALEAISAIEKLGTKVSVFSVDVTDKSALSQVLKDAALEYPLKGIFHLAGILEDGLVANQNEAQFKAAMAPKVQGGWNLHELTKEMNLDLFVLFSSAASIMGSASQGNYAAGNAFLDSLAVYRRNQGLPAHNINWGPWTSAGLVHQMGQEKKKRIQKQGLGLISMDQGMALTSHLINQPGRNSVVLSLNTGRFEAALSTVTNEVPAIYRELLGDRKLQSTKENPAELIGRLSAMEADAGKKELETMLQEVIGRILSVSDIRKIHLDKSLQEFGMDSLMSVELRNKLSAMFGTKLSVTLLFDYPNIKALATFLWENIISHGQVEEEVNNTTDWKQVVQQGLLNRLKEMDTNGQVDYEKSLGEMMKELEKMIDRSTGKKEEIDERMLDDLTLEELEDEFEKELKDL